MQTLTYQQCSSPAMSMAKGLSALQPVYQPTTLPFSTTGRSYRRPPTSPTGHTDTLRVVRICKRQHSVTAAPRLPAGSSGCSWNPHQSSRPAILAYRLQPVSCMCPLVFCESSSSLVHRHLNSTLNTLFITSFVPRGFKAVKKRGVVLVCLGLPRQDYSILAVGLCV